MSTKPHFSLLATSFAGGPRPRNAALILAGLWFAIFFAALFSPPILDDADATHAQAARAMATTGDLVTLRVDGIRYLEKAPLPYWLAAASFRVFGFNTFAAHLPQALAVALLVLLGHRWANQAFGARTAFYTAIALLTSLGTFLFTRILIPEALLSLLLAAALFAFLKTLGPISSEPKESVPLSAQLQPQQMESVLLSPHLQPQQMESVVLSPRLQPWDQHAQGSEASAPEVRSPSSNPHSPGAPSQTASSSEMGPTTSLLVSSGTGPGLKVPQGFSLGSLRASHESGLQPLGYALPSQPQTVPHSSQPHRDEWVHPLPSERPAHIPPAAALYPYLMWTFLALAVLTKGLVALVFFLATTLLYLLLVGEFKTSLPKLKPLTGLLLFLAIAAPWHILAALRNPGFLRFYFWNEHVLRFLGTRTPPDFNRLPGYLYWTLHLVWLFPWSLFLPLGLAALWHRVRHQTSTLTGHLGYFSREAWSMQPLPFGGFLLCIPIMGLLLSLNLQGYRPPALEQLPLGLGGAVAAIISSRRARAGLPRSPFHRIDPQQRTILLLSLFAAIVLLFFSLSTNQEYYTFPAYLPLLLLIAATVTRAEQTYASSHESRRWITVAHAAFTLIGAAAALTLLYGLFASRHLPYTPDIGTLLLRRNVASNTLSLSHLFDLTTGAFAALRLPAALAAAALLLGPALAWLLRTQRRHIAATTAIAFTSGLFLIAAHLAFARFAPMLSSQAFAAQIQQIESTHPQTQILIFGDQAYGSSLPFYLNRQVQLVDGRSTSLLFGSTYPEVEKAAPQIFLTPAQLAATWSQPPQKLLFIPAERREEALRLLPPNPNVLCDESGKLLLAHHPLP